MKKVNITLCGLALVDMYVILIKDDYVKDILNGRIRDQLVKSENRSGVSKPHLPRPWETVKQGNATLC